eukprot:GHRQ01018091.1.p3 GENE.GHRQ01018091.1~~GHRQ01018091.1.p3  ORF type:complete len:107 (-),score=29.08 GHRQ01018091.1:774-1094(-)
MLSRCGLAGYVFRSRTFGLASVRSDSSSWKPGAAAGHAPGSTAASTWPRHVKAALQAGACNCRLQWGFGAHAQHSCMFAVSNHVCNLLCCTFTIITAPPEMRTMHS